MPSLIEHIQHVGVSSWPALLLMVVGLVSAPLLVRRALREQAVSPARWRSPGVELIMLCWLAFGVDTATGLEAIRYTCGARPWAVPCWCGAGPNWGRVLIIGVVYWAW